jgi:large subunit ribosomal protein L30
MSSARKPGGARRKKPQPARTPAARKAPKRRTAPAAARASARVATAASATVASAPAAPAGRPAGGMIVIEQDGSGIGCQLRQKKTLRALGLRHPRHRVVRPDNPAVRGMVNAIPHLVRIVEDTHAA